LAEAPTKRIGSFEAAKERVECDPAHPVPDVRASQFLSQFHKLLSPGCDIVDLHSKAALHVVL
jgi:hypothetical protein